MRKIKLLTSVILLCFIFSACNPAKPTEEAIRTNITISEATQPQAEADSTKKEENDLLVNSYSLSELGITLTIPKDKIPISPYIDESYKERNIDLSNLNSEAVSNTDTIDVIKTGFISISESLTNTRLYLNLYKDNQSMVGDYVYDFVAFKKSDFAFNKNQSQEKEELGYKLYKIEFNMNDKPDLYLTYDELITNFRVYGDKEILICDISPLTLYYNYFITNEDGTSHMPNPYQGNSREDFLISRFGEEIKNPEISWTDEFFDYIDNHFKEAIGKE